MLALAYLIQLVLSGGVRLFRFSPELFVLAFWLLPPAAFAIPALWWGGTAYFVCAVLALIIWAAVVIFRAER